MEEPWNSKLTERSQIQKSIYCRIPLTWSVWNRQIHRDWKLPEAGGSHSGEWLLMSTVFLFWPDGNVLELDSGNYCTTLWIKTAEQYILEWLKWCILCHMNFISIKKKKTRPKSNPGDCNVQPGLRMETAVNKHLMWKGMDGKEERAELRGQPVSSRIRLSYSFPDIRKVHKISHFAPVPELHNFSAYSQ